MTDWIDQITELRRQREAGTLSDDEFEARRQSIMVKRNSSGTSIDHESTASAAEIQAGERNQQAGTSSHAESILGAPPPASREDSSLGRSQGSSTAFPWRAFGVASVSLAAVSLVLSAAVIGNADGWFSRKWTRAIVWNGPVSADTSNAMAACKTWDCFIDLMVTNHAPLEAVKFVKAMEEKSPDDYLGIPVAFYGLGRVKVVEIFFPDFWRIGKNGEIVFVNGARPIQRPIGDIQYAATTNEQFQKFRNQYPGVTLWPSGPGFRNELTTANGGQQFQFGQTLVVGQTPVVGQSLVNSCHKCITVGSFNVAYNFDKAGRYKGMSALGVQPVERAKDH